MLVSAYAAFVDDTDVSKTTPDARFDIALYGLVGEVGSLVAAIKKRLLAAGRRNWNVPNDEIVEELGDCLWYVFAIGAASGFYAEFVASDIRNLVTEISEGDPRAERIRTVLGEEGCLFLIEAPLFLARWSIGEATLDDYRRVAFLTARTKGDQLVEVCLAVLQQLTAELLRSKLPSIEKELNRRLPDRSVEALLGEVFWHVAALASLYGLELGDVAERNVTKLERRFGRSKPTPLPDQDRAPSERLSRRFEVSFVTVGPGRSRMYMDGAQLGDDLTDNAYAEDGYRFHDVLHLALAGKLGWSPVLRKLMGRKRRSDARLDEIEDGARAMIVEEAVIKAIHAEGLRISALSSPPGGTDGVPLVTNGRDISFAFLKRLESLVTGLEAERNKYWEWEDVIVDGFALFHRLRQEGRGTVSVDLDERSLIFSSEVILDVQGRCAGIGSASAVLDEDLTDRATSALESGAGSMLACRRAVLECLSLSETHMHEIDILGWKSGILDVRARGQARNEMWHRGIVVFRATAAEVCGSVVVTAFAIADQ